MAKQNTGSKPPTNTAAPAAPAATVTAPTVVQAGKPTVPGVLQVKAGASLRGARLAWYGLLLKHNGKPVAEFLAAAAATPPSLPKSGVAEKPQGWLGWFQRSGLAAVVPPGAKPPAP